MSRFTLNYGSICEPKEVFEPPTSVMATAQLPGVLSALNYLGIKIGAGSETRTRDCLNGNQKL